MKNLLVLVLSYVACTIVHSESEAFQKLDLESEKCESACAAKPLAYEVMYKKQPYSYYYRIYYFVA